MDLHLENSQKNAQFDFSQSKNELPVWSCDSGSSTARDTKLLAQGLITFIQ